MADVQESHCVEAVNGDRMKAACDIIFAKGIRDISDGLREEEGQGSH